MTMHRRDFVGSGLLAGLFLSVPAWAGQKADQRAREPRKVTGRVDLEAKDDDGLCLNVYLTNHGKTAEELQSDGGHAMLREDSITLDGQEAFLFPMAPMTRMGPRPDKRHNPLQHVKHLWQFIQAGGAQELADPGYTRVVSFGLWHALLRRTVEVHGAELVDIKHFIIEAIAFLPKNHRAPAIQFNGRRDGYKQGQDQDQYKQ